MKISLHQPANSAGVEVVNNFSGTPNEYGILQQYELETAQFDVASYFAPYQKYDVLNAASNNWPDGSNRIQALRITSFDNLKNGGMFLILRLTQGGYMVLLPLVGPSTIAWFCSENATLKLNLGTLGTAAVSGNLPLLAWATDTNLYAACQKVWELTITHPTTCGHTRWREIKHYPDVFTYLGWCTWEEYHKEIDEELLLNAVDCIENSPIPIRYILVDDGHISHDNRRITSFAPNPTRFPNGWEKLIGCKSDKLRWFGLWLNFNGYWDGICPQNQLGELNQHLAPVNEKALQPKLEFLSSFAFYDAFIGSASEAGFDFVKVDNQAKNLNLYRRSSQPVESATNNSQALETACSRHMHGLINCMAHGPVCIFNTRLSAITRCSEDYKVGNLARARRHLHNSYANIPWMGQTVWGDHDMFHSSDAFAGRILALSKAMSGAPIYLSDNPQQFVAESIMPLCYSDGRLLRPLAPAAPLPESLFIDPFAENKAFRVVAPLANGVAAIVAYNFTEPEVPVTATITADDYTHANGMMQPASAPWQVPAEGLLLYNWQTHVAQPLQQTYTATINGFGDLFVLLCPINQGWAVVGRVDKFLSPAAVEVIYQTEHELVVRMVEGGELTVWSASGALSAGPLAVRRGVNGLWHCDVPVGAKDVVVKITRE